MMNFDKLKMAIILMLLSVTSALAVSLTSYQTDYICILLILAISLIVALLVYPNKMLYRLQKLNIALEQSDDLVCITDKNQRIEYVNKAFENISGYTQDELIGKKVNSVIKSGKVNRDTYTQMYERINNGLVWKGEFVNRKKDGDLYTVNATISSIRDNKGNIKNYISVQQDITQEKLKQKELEIKDKILVEQYKFNSLNNLIKNIAHHWRQPLNVVSIYNASLDQLNDIDDKQQLEEEIKSIQNHIEQQLSFLSTTIDNFQYISTNEYHKDIFDINQAVNKSINIIKASCNASNIDITCECKEGFELDTYENVLMDVLISIYQNAKESIMLKQQKQKDLVGNITVTIIDKKVIITDNGDGIHEAIIDKIFEPYFTTKFQSRGVGLSLYMDKIMVNDKLNASIYATASNTQGIITIDFDK